MDSKNQNNATEGLPPITKEPIVAEASDQLRVTIFPPGEDGQPEIDTIRVDFKTVEGKETAICMTPCEALELSQCLSGALQMFLYNQEQYRNDVLIPRLQNAKERQKLANG